jgi:hypothetical protein
VLLLRAGRAAGQDISRELAAWLPDPARADVRLAAATDARGLTRRNAP